MSNNDNSTTYIENDTFSEEKTLGGGTISKIITDLVLKIHNDKTKACLDNLFICGPLVSQTIITNQQSDDAKKLAKTSSRFILAIININNNHWITMAVDKELEVFHIFDSLASVSKKEEYKWTLKQKDRRFDQYKNCISKFATTIDSKFATTIDSKIAQRYLCYVHNVPQQPKGDIWSCGYFALLYVLKLCVVGPENRRLFFEDTSDRARFESIDPEYKELFRKSLEKTYLSSDI